jgi:adenylate cyclase
MSKVKRKLTTILATDCVGFSRRMEEDEELTLENLKACRSLIDPLVKDSGGRIFYTAGDSVIAEFESPVECVNAAIGFQKAIHDRNKTLSEKSKLDWRVGIHLDDVIIEGDNVYGNGVNIAARLETACTPGQILLSTAVQDQVNKRISHTIEDAGTKPLKNIDEAYQVYGISPSGEKVVKTNATEEKKLLDANRSYKPKLAVLPFDNMNNDEDGGYLVDGVVEDLITEFSRIRELEVLSRQSCFEFRDTDSDLSSFCKKFGVDYAVSGSIRSSGKRVRISIELSDTSDGKALWNNKYDRILEDIFDVQDEIVRKISIALLGEIEISSLERANRKPTENLTSYELLLKGKVLHHKFKKESCLEAIESFDKAIKADTKNGQAYAWKACAIGQAMGRGYVEGDMEEWWDTSMKCIEQAQQLNDNDFEVHRMLAEVALSSHDFKAGERHARACYKMVPNDPRVLSVYGEVLVRIGATEKGLELLESALELDPIPMGKTNTDHRTRAVLFAHFMEHNREKCLEIISSLQEVDLKSWILTAKICSDDQFSFENEGWFKDNKPNFKEADWEMEIDRFHLNNDGLTKSLEEFAKSIY